MATQKLPRSPGHPFYERLNQVLGKAGFDAFVETLCARFYADGIGRPSLRPGRYFRILLVGYFEGLNSERAIAWRVADSDPLSPSILFYCRAEAKSQWGRLGLRGAQWKIS